MAATGRLRMVGGGWGWVGQREAGWAGGGDACWRSRQLAQLNNVWPVHTATQRSARCPTCPNTAAQRRTYAPPCPLSCTQKRSAPEKPWGRLYQNMARSVPPLPPQHQYLQRRGESQLASVSEAAAPGLDRSLHDWPRFQEAAPQQGQPPPAAHMSWVILRNMTSNARESSARLNPDSRPGCMRLRQQSEGGRECSFVEGAEQTERADCKQCWHAVDCCA